jgi:micrococcal nuclease
MYARPLRLRPAAIFLVVLVLLACGSLVAGGRLYAEEAPAGTPVYVTNSGQKYHRESCGALSRSKIAVSLGEAWLSGYEPCGICTPPVLQISAQSGLQSAQSAAPLYRVNVANLRSVTAADLSRMIRAEVVGHVDGDTVRVRISNPPEGLGLVETIRMIGVDTPETVHPQREVEFFGKEASAFTRDRLLGKPVLLAFDWDPRDRYGRLLAYIYTPDGTCHNAALVREGYGHAYTRFSFQFMDEFRALEQQARQGKRGLWGD